MKAFNFRDGLRGRVEEVDYEECTVAVGKHMVVRGSSFHRNDCVIFCNMGKAMITAALIQIPSSSPPGSAGKLCVLGELWDLDSRLRHDTGIPSYICLLCF